MFPRRYKNNLDRYKELMDFQTRLYELDKINSCLYDIGFTKLSVYSSYEKVIAENNQTEKIFV